MLLCWRRGINKTIHIQHKKKKKNVTEREKGNRLFRCWLKYSLEIAAYLIRLKLKYVTA